MDIVETLRGVRRNGSWNMLKPRGNEAHPLCQKAAKEIEGLRSTLAARDAVIAEKEAEIARLTQERDLLRKAIVRYGDKNRMAWAPPEMQQVIDDAFIHAPQDTAAARAALQERRT